MDTPRKPWHLTAFAVLALAGTAALAGCSSSSSSSGTTGSKAEKVAAAGGRADLAKPDSGTAPQAAGAGKAPDLNTRYAADQRAIVYTGTMTVRVGDVNSAAVTLTEQVRAAGGFVGADRREGTGGRQSAQLTLRVPAADFGSIVDQAGALGEPLTRNLSTEDVTTEVVDLDARIQAGAASVDRVRALLDRAQNLSDITTIEAELAKREADLESLRGQKRKLDDLTALSTLTVTLVARDVPAPKPVKHRTGFLAGLYGGWRAFTGFVDVLLTIIGALLPFLVAATALAAPVWWLVRRRRTGRPAPPGGRTDEPPGPPGVAG